MSEDEEEEDNGFRVYVYRCPHDLVEETVSGNMSATATARICWSGEERVQQAITAAALNKSLTIPPMAKTYTSTTTSSKPYVMQENIGSKKRKKETSAASSGAVVSSSRRRNDAPIDSENRTTSSASVSPLPQSQPPAAPLSHTSARDTALRQEKWPCVHDEQDEDQETDTETEAEPVDLNDEAHHNEKDDDDGGDGDGGRGLIGPNSDDNETIVIISGESKSKSKFGKSADTENRRNNQCNTQSIGKKSPVSKYGPEDTRTKSAVPAIGSNSSSSSSAPGASVAASAPVVVPPSAPSFIPSSATASGKSPDHPAAEENGFPQSAEDSMQLRERSQRTDAPTSRKGSSSSSPSASAAVTTTTSSSPRKQESTDGSKAGSSPTASTSRREDHDDEDKDDDLSAVSIPSTGESDDDKFFSCSSEDSDGVRRKKKKTEKRLSKEEKRSKTEDPETKTKTSPKEKESGVPVPDKDHEEDNNYDDVQSPARVKRFTDKSTVLNPVAVSAGIHQNLQDNMPVDSDEEADITAPVVPKPGVSSRRDRKENGKPVLMTEDEVHNVSTGDDDDDDSCRDDKKLKNTKKRKRLLASSDDEEESDDQISDTLIPGDSDEEDLPSGDDSDHSDGENKNKNNNKKKKTSADQKFRTNRSKKLSLKSTDTKSNAKKKREEDSADAIVLTNDGDGDNDDGDSDSSSRKEKDRKKRRNRGYDSSGEDYEPNKDSDSDADGNKKKDTKNKKNKGNKASDGGDDENKRNKKKRKRRRVKVIELDTDEERSKDDATDKEDDDDEEKTDASEELGGKPSPKTKGKKSPSKKRILTMDDFEKDTQLANKAEKDRRARLLDRQRLYNKLEEVACSGFEGSSQADCKNRRLVLEWDEETKEPLVEVAEVLSQQLKPHQVSGIKFLYACTIESLDLLSREPGSGCILAHSMGLGKTLQTITFVHTILKNEHTSKHLKSILIVCPKNTCRNWAQEFEKWLFDNHLSDFRVDDFDTVKTPAERRKMCRKWQANGGVLIIGSNMFASLAKNALSAMNPDFGTGRRGAKVKKKKDDSEFQKAMFECLLVPGADVVVVDEGHLIKNEKTHLNVTLSRMRTARRVILTGTPLQNNLMEYHCMVEFVKPRLLGTKKEFFLRFESDIKAGQTREASETDVRVMKRKVHVLHRLLAGCVQRCDYSVLAPYLQPKHEYVIKLRLSLVQRQLYEHYLEHFSRSRGQHQDKFREIKKKGKGYLFNDCNVFRLIAAHPVILRVCQQREDDRREEAAFLDNGSDTPSHSSSEGAAGDEGPDITGASQSAGTRRVTRSKKGQENRGPDSPITLGTGGWFEEYFPPDIESVIEYGVKMTLLFEIINKCERIGDKLIVFSQSLDTLDQIQCFLSDIHKLHAKDFFAPKTKTGGLLPGGEEEPLRNTWLEKADWYRIDGQTSAEQRKKIIDKFNDSSNTRFRLILISTRAGSLGINLVGANRCVIFDASWNPTHDVQAIYRIYRFGQTKPCYIYRFLCLGTMEEKIYGRQIQKQALAGRVVDDQTIDAVFSDNDLAELYQLDPEPAKEIVPVVPKDRLFADILSDDMMKKQVIDYHHHDSLLEDKPDKELTEAEREQAWNDYQEGKEDRVRDEQRQAAAAAEAQRQRDMAAQYQAQLQAHLMQQQQQQHHSNMHNVQQQHLSHPEASVSGTGRGRGRGRPPGSLNFEPEKVYDFDMAAMIQLVKTLAPNASPSQQLQRLLSVLQSQAKNVEDRVKYLTDRVHLFPDFGIRLTVCAANRAHTAKLLEEYSVVQAMYQQTQRDEARRHQLQEQLAHLQRKEVNRIQLNRLLDDPD